MQTLLVLTLCGVGGTIAVLALAAHAFGAGNVQSWLTATSGWVQLLAAIGAAWFAYGQLIEMKNQLAESRRTSAVQAESLLRQYFSEIEAQKQLLGDYRRATSLLRLHSDLLDPPIAKQEDFDAHLSQGTEALNKLENELLRPTPSAATVDIRSKCLNFFTITVRLEAKWETLRFRSLSPETLASDRKDARGRRSSPAGS